jgi:hypothetical protein
MVLIEREVLDWMVAQNVKNQRLGLSSGGPKTDVK